LPWLRQAVIDVKNIRHHHLKDMGGQSYGSLIRKEIKNAKKIQIIGAGHLVQEILPWLTKTQLPLSLHVRNPKNIKITLPESLQVFPLEKPMDWEGIVILAAPLRSTDFSRIMKIKNNFLTSRKSPCKVMDLRGTCETDPLEKSWTIVDLKMLTNHLQSNEVRMNLLKEDVNHEILVKSEKLWMKAKLRPHGWEDICA
ncbi:MAG: hypothetical protein K1X29_10955, partial [Bdellovibrionales bacterium]|nr:hypothetical protein [Bdellovibrionales bacterium]